jgi:hypothetical protein
MYRLHIFGFVAAIMALAALAAIVLIMALPENLDYYRPIFHINSLWLLATGIVIIRNGLRLQSDTSG